MFTIDKFIVNFVAIWLAMWPESVVASSEAFTVERKAGSLRASVDAAAFESELRNAMGEALGCGGLVSDQHLADIEQALMPMYRTLPKNSNGRLERRSLRHLAHRYFNERSSLIIRGFEPSRPVNESSWGSAEILSQRVPGFVESVLESRHRADRGFDLKDAAYMIATIEQLVFDSESTLLEKVYQSQRKPLQRPLGDHGLKQVLEAYLVHWLMGDDQEGIDMLLNKPSLLHDSFPHWDLLVKFAEGEIRALDYRRQQHPKTQGHSVGNALKQRYSFDDAHEVVGDITRSFASFWESECIEMKESLIAMDTHHTGRVPLSKFYGTGLDAEWRFGESESYLRELGALDESGWRGKQVIIPNYIQAASNCIVTTSHYMVCCANDCNPIISEIEAAVGAPYASVEQILSIVGNMTSLTSIDDEIDVNVDPTLSAQLKSIAESHSGEVPIHGRLFLQWLHYVFPRDCAFPHKTGTVAAVAPLEYNGNYIATVEEMKTHAAVNDTSDITVEELGREELQWMSQWSEDEELVAGYEGLRKTSTWRTKFALCLFLVAGMLGTVSFNRKSSNSDMLLPTSRKAHFV